MGLRQHIRRHQHIHQRRVTLRRLTVHLAMKRLHTQLQATQHRHMTRRLTPHQAILIQRPSSAVQAMAVQLVRPATQAALADHIQAVLQWAAV